jgi:hypothetical protein
MADLNATFSLTGSGILTAALDVESPTSQVAIGQGGFPAVGFSLTYGTGNLQAQSWWSDKRTVAAGATDSIDLNGGGLVGPLGAAVNFTNVKVVIIAIDTPDGVKLLRVGPQGVANAAQLGFGGTGAQAYVETGTFCVLPRPYGGWAITPATADLLPVKNPSAVSVDYYVWVIGTP